MNTTLSLSDDLTFTDVITNPLFYGGINYIYNINFMYNNFYFYPKI